MIPELPWDTPYPEHPVRVTWRSHARPVGENVPSWEGFSATASRTSGSAPVLLRFCRYATTRVRLFGLYESKCGTVS